MEETRAFSASQADFLQCVAHQNPKLWEYQCKVKILDAHNNGDVSIILSSLIDTRNMLKRGLLELPPQRNLSQYYTINPASIVKKVKVDDERSAITFVPFLGQDPREWLIAAYENAEEMLEIAEKLIEVCQRSADTSPDEELFILDPPLLADDPRVIPIQQCIRFFSAMTAEDVLRVFDSRKGILKMATSTKWINAAIVEAIRIGLEVQPKVLQRVQVQHGNGPAEPWLTDDDPKRNRFGAHVNSARTKGYSRFSEIDSKAQDIIRNLRQVVSLQVERIGSEIDSAT